MIFMRFRGPQALNDTYEKQAGWEEGAFPPSSLLSQGACQETQVLSLHGVAHSFVVFCTRSKFNPFLIKHFRTLCTKRRVWAKGRQSPFTSHSCFRPLALAFSPSMYSICLSPGGRVQQQAASRFQDRHVQR